MMDAAIIRVEPGQWLTQLARHHNAFPAALDHMQAIFDRYHISANALRAAHFSAQVMHETTGLRHREECLSYDAGRLAQVWPRLFAPRGPHDPCLYAHDARALANLVYGRRGGNMQDGDGYLFRGRGLLQLTFRDNYRNASAALGRTNPSGPDLCEAPDLVWDAKWALEVAAAYWYRAGCNEHADQDSLEKVTHAINGGLNGMPLRRKWLKKMKLVYGI